MCLRLAARERIYGKGKGSRVGVSEGEEEIIQRINEKVRKDIKDTNSGVKLVEERVKRREIKKNRRQTKHIHTNGE